MNKGFSGENKYREFVRLKSRTDSEIVFECLQKNRAAWEEFFRRFTPHITASIKSSLHKKGCGHLGYVDRAFDEISERVLDKLFKKNILAKCEDPSDIRSWRNWLATVCDNETIDWLRARNRLKQLPKLPIDDPVKSLNQPLSDDTDATLGDILPDIPDTNVALKQRVEAALEAVSLIVDEKKRWAFRLGLITQAPLSDEEICTLARFNGSSLDALKVRLAPVLAALERREHERENFGKIAIQLWHELRRLEAQLCDGFFRPDAEDAETLEDAIMALSARREEHLQKSQKHIRPTNKEIAMLIGMPFAQSDQISTILLRERSFLEGLMTKHAKTGCL